MDPRIRDYAVSPGGLASSTTRLAAPSIVASLLGLGAVLRELEKVHEGGGL